MGHEIGKLEKVQRFVVGNREFKTLEEATTYQQELDKEKKVDKIREVKTASLKSNAKDLEKVNNYYGIFNNVLFKGAEADKIFTSFVLDTPRETLKLLLSLDEKELAEDGPIKEELPLAYPAPGGEVDEFVEELIKA
jgi:hypothetical protein